MSDDKKPKNGKPTLDDADIKTERGVDRRSVLRGFGIGGLGLGGLAVTGCVPTTGMVAGSGITDADNGRRTDAIGFGRGSPRSFRTGITDVDNGRITDRGGYGRG